MWTDFKRIINSGFIGFWRNSFVSFSAIFVMTVTLFVIGGISLFSQLLDASLTQIQEKVDINVYFVTNAEESDIKALQTKLQTLPEVAEIKFTSREVALTQFKDRHKNDQPTIQALEELGDNPLGASLSVRAKETSQYEGIAAFLDEQQILEDAQSPLIDRVNYLQNKISIEKLTTIIDAVERSSFIAMIVLVVASVLITFNTIRLAIYTSREEIGVMRLVGASNMFIRGPFIFQGVMYGLISGVITLLMLYPIVLWNGPVTETFFEFNIFSYYVSNFGSIFLLIVGSGVLLGTISSVLAVARYLRV